MPDLRQSFRLFPLGVVLLPNEVLPLHIFEDRYKLMIGECLDQDEEFGVLWLSDDGLRETGCTARVTEVLERLEDGRMNILTTGARPFRLLRRIEDLPYPAGDIELLDDDAGGGDDSTVATETRERYADLVERVTDERPATDGLETLDAYAMAATIELDPAAKQTLLDQRSEDERLRTLGRLLELTVRRLDASERAGELAQTNGKPHL